MLSCFFLNNKPTRCLYEMSYMIYMWYIATLYDETEKQLLLNVRHDLPVGRGGRNFIGASVNIRKGNIRLITSLLQIYSVKYVLAYLWIT